MQGILRHGISQKVNPSAGHGLTPEKIRAYLARSWVRSLMQGRWKRVAQNAALHHQTQKGALPQKKKTVAEK